jgi:MFS family permease
MTARHEVARPDGVSAGLPRRDLWQVVATLSAAQITSWGVLYYAFTVLQGPISADTGWSHVAIAAAFSAGQVVNGATGIWVGRHLDAYGPRRLMTGFGLLAVTALVVIATASSFWTFAAGWLLAGAAMAGSLYPPAFAALTHWGGAGRVRALTTLTLVGGLASTVFAPLTTSLDQAVGWRTTYLLLAAVLLIAVTPLHWWGLAKPWTPAGHVHELDSDVPHDDLDEVSENSAGGTTVTDPRAVTRSAPFVLLATGAALLTLATYALVVNLVPALVDGGLSPGTAALALGLGGVGQVAGRLGYARFAAATTPTGRLVIVGAATAAATVALALAPPIPALVIVIAMLLGLARGVYTLIQATAVTDRWGTHAYGRLSGVLTAPSLLAAAAAPFVGAALAAVLGSWTGAFLALAGLAAVGAVVIACSAPPRVPVRPVTSSR